MTNHITTTWLEGMKFDSTNPSGNKLIIEATPENGEQAEGLRPKALMLSALAGCSGLDVASLIKKMKLDVADFKIEIAAELTEEDPKYYHKVDLNFHFYGDNLNENKLQRAVDLSVEKYCGVMEMFRHFATVKVETHFHKLDN